MHLKVFSSAVFLLLSLVALFSNEISAYKYLGVIHTAAKSHFIVGSSLIKALAEKGHEVYVISPFPQKTPIKNYHDIPVPSVLTAMEGEINNLFTHNERSMIENVVNYYKMGVNITETVLLEPAVQKLIASNHTFDAVICEVFLSEALFGLSELFNAPLIGLGTFGAASWNTDMVGSPSPPSYVPGMGLKFSNYMTLTERVGNLAYNTFDRFFMDWYYLPKQAELYDKYFPNVKRDMYEVRKNAALVLLNTHVSLAYARPYVPNQIEVGGMHINRKTKPLPEDIAKFINESEHGVVYFSMGSNLKSKNMPQEKKAEILKAFGKLKQRVLWKFEDSELEGKPDNVLIRDWFPQDDILAHENVKVFITHGGLLSTTESIYHRTPVIGIPIFGDQFLNMGNAEKQGYGLMLDYQTLTADKLSHALNRILNEPSFQERVTEISNRYRDQETLPMEKAIFWVEHVVRQKGARYMHCAGLDLNFIEYHNIDAMLILYGGILFTLFCFVYFVYLLIMGFVKSLRAKPKRVKQKKH
ncbi:UDP-glucosyltransferase 2-like [Musca autumnalis]|uniref:UDP-glucosyltransferase 2-like n=1 Tax=Musca autumnalis TaxID=221902 RepID=UPI003CF986E2